MQNMSLNGKCMYATFSMSKSYQIAIIIYRHISSLWFSSVWSGPNYWSSWTSPDWSVARL